jgi:hypothetical protein
MTDEEFRQIVSQDSALAGPLKRAAAAADSQQFVLGIGEAAALVFMFPIAQFVLTQIGLPWLYEAKRYSETRSNVALALRGTGRLGDALLYAQASLRNYATYGDRAAAEIQWTQRLIERIEKAMRGG